MLVLFTYPAFLILTGTLNNWESRGTTISGTTGPDIPRDLPFYALSSTALGICLVIFSQLLAFAWFLRYKIPHIPIKSQQFFFAVFCTSAFITLYYFQLGHLFDERSFFEKEGELHISLKFFLKISDAILFTALFELLASYRDSLFSPESLDLLSGSLLVSSGLTRRKRSFDRALVVVTIVIAGFCSWIQFSLLARERSSMGRWLGDMERVALYLDQLHDLVLFPILTVDVLITSLRLKSWLKRDDAVPNTQINTIIYKLEPTLISFAIYRSVFTWVILPHWNGDYPTYQAVVGVVIGGMHHILIVRFLNRIARGVYRAVNTETPFVPSNGEVPI